MSSSWQVKKLDEVCSLITDGVHNSPKYVDNGIPMLDAKDIQEDFSIDDRNPRKFITREIDDELSKRCKPKLGDVLVSSRGSIGKIAIVQKGQDFNIMGNIILLRAPDNLDSKYIAFVLKSKLDELQAISRGVAQKGLYLKQVRNFQIPLPLIAEQKRIVAILDEAFEGIDGAIANTEKNLANARELFESYLNAIFTRKGDDWEEKKVSEIGGKVFTGPFGSLLHKADYVSDGIPIVNPANIEDGEIIPNWKKTVSPAIIERLQSYVLSQNDIVIGRRGEIGRCAVVREKHTGWLCGSGSFFIKTFENVDSDFRP